MLFCSQFNPVSNVFEGEHSTLEFTVRIPVSSKTQPFEALLSSEGLYQQGSYSQSVTPGTLSHLRTDDA